jgi:hypothetical protein
MASTACQNHCHNQADYLMCGYCLDPGRYWWRSAWVCMRLWSASSLRSSSARHGTSFVWLHFPIRMHSLCWLEPLQSHAGTWLLLARLLAPPHCHASRRAVKIIQLEAMRTMVHADMQPAARARSATSQAAAAYAAGDGTMVRYGWMHRVISACPPSQASCAAACSTRMLTSAWRRLASCQCWTPASWWVLVLRCRPGPHFIIVTGLTQRGRSRRWPILDVRRQLRVAFHVTSSHVTNIWWTLTPRDHTFQPSQ